MKLHLVVTHRALPALDHLDDVLCTVVFWEFGTLRTELLQFDRVHPAPDDDGEEEVHFFSMSPTQEMVFDQSSILLVSEIESITVST
jgi:hypothetical protein